MEFFPTEKTSSGWRLVTPRDPIFDRMLPHPWMRKMVLRLPGFMQPAPKRYSFVLGWI